MSLEDLVKMNGDAMAVMDEVPYQPMVCAIPREWLAIGAISAFTQDNRSLTRTPDEEQHIEEEEDFNEFLARLDEEYGYDEQQMKYEVPIWEKSNLTLEEAAAYSGIGISKLREISNEPGCKFVSFIGTKRMFKCRLPDAYIEKTVTL